MAVFYEHKVINGLHTDKAEIGKKYWYSDNFRTLKQYVEQSSADCNCGELIGINESVSDFNFMCKDTRSYPSSWALIYPYEEPPKQRMTHRQLAEWCAKGNGERGERTATGFTTVVSATYCYIGDSAYEEINKDMMIRSWGSDEWIEPTYERYLMDCKGVTQDEIDDVAWRDGC